LEALGTKLGLNDSFSDIAQSDSPLGNENQLSLTIMVVETRTNGFAFENGAGELYRVMAHALGDTSWELGGFQRETVLLHDAILCEFVLFPAHASVAKSIIKQFQDFL
jgi:hypothetical protein